MRSMCFVLVLSVLSSVVGSLMSVSEKYDLVAYDRELDRLFQEIVDRSISSNSTVRYYDSTLSKREQHTKLTIQDFVRRRPTSSPNPRKHERPRVNLQFELAVHKSRRNGSDPFQTSHTLVTDDAEGSDLSLGAVAADVLRRLAIPKIRLEDDDDFGEGPTRDDSYHHRELPVTSRFPQDLLENPDGLTNTDSEEPPNYSNVPADSESTTDSANNYRVEFSMLEAKAIEEPLPLCFMDLGPIKEKFHECIHSQLEPQNLQQTARTTSSLPNHRDHTQFLRSCRKTDVIRTCFKEYYDIRLDLCPNEDGNALLGSLGKVGVNITEFICKREADRISLLIRDGVLVCLKNNSFKIFMCLNAHFSFMEEAVFEPTSPKSVEQKCDDLREAEVCFSRHLESCEDTTLPDTGLVELLFDLARELASCGKTEPALKSDAAFYKGEKENETIHNVSEFNKDTAEEHNAENITEHPSDGHHNDRHSEDHQSNTNHSSYVEEKSNNVGHVPYQNPGIEISTIDEEHDKTTSELTLNNLTVEDHQVTIMNLTPTASRNVSDDIDAPLNYAAVGFILGLILLLMCLLFSTVTLRTQVQTIVST